MFRSARSVALSATNLGSVHVADNLSLLFGCGGSILTVVMAAYAPIQTSLLRETRQAEMGNRAVQHNQGENL
jgi:hypothetical protein